ncbi:hypothetical protein BC629DRAFT_1735238 [Irpex lacteus]|nr:hypothetical protein BC629DRAFT_1735238 [Irpex lacteus]
MAGESSKRSNLVDVSYQDLHKLVDGDLEGTSIEQVADIIHDRVHQLRNICNSFGTPSEESRRKVQSGTFILRDAVTLTLDDMRRNVSLAVSDEFGIDEVEAAILVNSFLWNDAYTGDKNVHADGNIQPFVEAITPFYYSERLFALRTLVPLFRAQTSGISVISDLANDILPEIIPDGKQFVEDVLSDGAVGKQNAKEQVSLLEVLYWSLWDYCPRDGPRVVKVYETAYNTNMGSIQANATLLLDEECTQITQDTAALWILITLEILELERVAEPQCLRISGDPPITDIYWLSPDSLLRIHELVTTHSGSQFACTYAAWAFFLSRFAALCGSLKELPQEYRQFYETIVPPVDRSYSKTREPAHVVMAETVIRPEAGLLRMLLTLLTASPLMVTSVAWKMGTALNDYNAIAYRSVLKGFLIGIVELVPVELIPEFDVLVEVWIALFGRSESRAIAAITCQFWQADWTHGIARRAIFDAARARFPIQAKPLIRLLRSMTAFGFLDTDPLYSRNEIVPSLPDLEQKDICGQHVFLYLNQLSTFTQIIPVSACSGPHAQYEKLPERMISSSVSTGLTYTNLRPLKLPGGSTLPPKSIGRLLNGDGGDFVAVAWQHEHSGWKVLLEILTDYVNRRRRVSNGGYSHDINFGPRVSSNVQVLQLEDIGVDIEPEGDDVLVTDILDLVRSVVQDSPELAAQLLQALESGETINAHTMLETETPDLVQLTTLILEDALSRHSQPQRNPPRTQLITSAISVLSALLALPQYSSRVWLYVRSTASLFGSERTVGFTSAVLASERLTGQYIMTLSLLNLVHQLFNEASSTVLSVLQDTPKLQKVKEEVLMRATRFVHSEIWVEHAGWKYSQLGDRFEIGRLVTALYANIVHHAPPIYTDAPFAALSQAVIEALITHATTSAINPLVQPLTAAVPVLKHLHATRRVGDARRLNFMLEAHLILIRVLLIAKQKVASSTKLCLLEQSLCTRASSGLYQSTTAKADPIDALAAIAQVREMGGIVHTTAVEVLFSLCVSLSAAQESSPTIVGHLSNPETIVTNMVRLIMHPYEEPARRKAVWNFIILAVDREPALAGLFVSGRFRTPSGPEAENAIENSARPQALSALTVTVGMLAQWKDLWEINPQGLASVLCFLHTVWEHGHEHKKALSAVRENPSFFDRLAAIVREELGPVPDYKTDDFEELDGIQHSAHHSAVSSHAYRMSVKAHAVAILALDIQMSLPQDKGQASAQPAAYKAIQSIFKHEDQMTDLIAEAGACPFDPSLYDELQERAQVTVPTLVVDHLRVQKSLLEREFGDDFAFSTSLLRHKLQPYAALLVEEVLGIQKTLMSINLNLSLAQAQTTLTEAWQFLLLQVVPFSRGDTTTRPIVLSLAANLAADIGSETRSGDVMSNAHNARLKLLLSLLEVAWFSTADKPGEVQHFISFANSLHNIVLNEAQSPTKSFLGQLPVPFHRPLLQAAYFCARHSRSLLRRPKVLNAEQRLSIASMLEAVLDLVIDALRITFDSARQRLDAEVDQDMELLVAVFEQCTRPDLNSSTTFWLSKCQQSDVIRASLQLFSQLDLVGYSDIDFLRSRKQPLYSSHVLSFHRALASIPSAAERLASEGILAAYSENSLTAAVRTGSIDAVLPDLPGERSPAQSAFCSMLAVIAGVATALGHHGQYFIGDACAVVQLYSEQIHRTLSWTIDNPLTLPLLEEMEQIVNVFYALSSSPRADDAIKRPIQFFTSDALLLLQQINYALTHQNHLASLFEPITASERTRYETDGPQAAPVSSTSDILDLARRPFLARLVHRLFRLSGSILLTLLNVSRGESVLLAEPEEWPLDQALIVPHSKVVLGEPVSLGTLLELGNHSLDVLRHLVDRPATQTVAIALSKNAEQPPDVRESVAATRRNLEAVVFYAATQLAMWLMRTESEIPSHEMDAEESAAELQLSEKERRAARRRSVTMGERLRRGMTGEMAMDLQSLLTKATPVIGKSDALLEKKGVDVTAILSNFLGERILVSS